jgi:hypothetical protein
LDASRVGVAAGVAEAAVETAQKEKFAAVKDSIKAKTGIFFIFHLFLLYP